MEVHYFSSQFKFLFTDDLSVLFHILTFLFFYLYVLTHGHGTIETLFAVFHKRRIISNPNISKSSDVKEYDNEEPKPLVLDENMLNLF